MRRSFAEHRRRTGSRASIAGCVQTLLEFTDVPFACKSLLGCVDRLGAKVQLVRMREG